MAELKNTEINLRVSENAFGEAFTAQIELARALNSMAVAAARLADAMRDGPEVNITGIMVRDGAPLDAANTRVSTTPDAR